MKGCQTPAVRAGARTGVLALAMTGALTLAGCSGSNHPTSRSSALAPTTATETTTGTAPARAPTASPLPTPSSTGLPTGWVDDNVWFIAGGMTVYGTYRHPAAGARVPSALLIAGSGNPDRNGDEPGFPENSLQLLADQLAADGVATLRYDKLGSGQTGLGPYATNPAALRVKPYADEAAAALRYLGALPRTDPAQISVYGHSEGALYALLLATGTAGAVPQVARIGLIEPLSRRTLDVAREQWNLQMTAAVTDGTLTSAAAQTNRQQINAAIIAIRAGRPPGPIPPFTAGILGPGVLGYVAAIDRYDPAVVAARLPATTKVFLTCSATDSQVYCADVEHLATGLEQANVTLDFLHLTNVDHGLKYDTSTTGAADLANLPMAPQLASAIAQFTGP